MARKALVVGINDYRGVSDLKGCISDVKNIRYLLKTFLGFENNDIRVLADSRATKAAIIERLKWMVGSAKSGDFLVFHFSGHGSQIRDRNGDELEDQMDELLCPYDMNWDGTFILDDDLADIFKNLPDNVLLEVILDCCHSGTGTRGNPRPVDSSEPPRLIRYLPPPPDIVCRYEGDEHLLQPTKRFTSANRSTMNHILWAASRAEQTSADAFIGDSYNGAFTYYFCKHFRDTQGKITRRNLMERVRDSLKYNHFEQIPQLECRDEATKDRMPFQFSLKGSARDLYLTTPLMRGEDVKKVQTALADIGYKISADGVFGPHTQEVVMQFQRKNNLTVNGVVGTKVRELLFK